MITLDNLLLNIVNQTTPAIEELLPSRDTRVLRNIATAINSHFFITENQSRLLIKILKEHQKKLSGFTDELTVLLADPTWSRKFRHIEQVKKLYIVPSIDNGYVLAIEFTFSAQIRKIVQSLSNTVSGMVQALPGKIFHADYTEKNIIALVEALTPLQFNIDETIKNHYDTIKSWSETEVRDQFVLTNITHQNFQKQITADLGIATAIDNNIINDRSIRYQYFTENTEKSGENLTSVIANRDKTKVWIDSNQFSLNEIFQSLVELKRLPCMVIFDNYNPGNSLKYMKLLKNSLEENNITTGVGIYFRLPNDDMGKDFNQFISDNSYNQYLDVDTSVVGVQSGKIPKFFLSSTWKPMSVIALDTNLKHSKTAVYANCCDLIISYSDAKPLYEAKTIWE